MNYICRFFWFFSVITYFLLLLETKFYSGLILNKIGIPIEIFIVISFLLGLTIITFFKNYYIKKQFDFFPFFLKINLNLSPLIFLVYILLVILEKINYPNFVLAIFRVDINSFFYLFIFSSFLAIYYLLITASNFKFLKNLCLFLPIIVMILFCLQNRFGGDFWYLTVEDGPIEYLQFIFFLFSAVLAFKTSFMLKKINKKASNLYFFITFGLFFIAMEEISWGQRLLGIETFEKIKEINTQDELTIHNLEPIQKILNLLYIIVGFFGAFLWLIASKIIKFKNKLWFNLLVPPPFLFTLFVLPFILYFYIEFIDKFIIKNFNFYLFPEGGWREVVELFLALGFLIFFIRIYQKVFNQDID